MDFADRCGQGFERSGSGRAQEVFQLGEDLPDRIARSRLSARPGRRFAITQR